MQDHVPSFPTAATPEEVRRQLDKLLASHWFARSGRMCRFLRFAVERASVDSTQPHTSSLVHARGTCIVHADDQSPASFFLQAHLV
jgi:hypothetical protein